MRRALARQAIVFSLFSLVIAGFLLLLFWGWNWPRLDRTTQAQATRVASMDQHLTLFEAYISAATQSCVRVALRNITLRLDGSTPLFTNAQIQTMVWSCLQNGTMVYPPGSGIVETCADAGGSLEARLLSFESIAHQELGVRLNHTFANDFSLSDRAPFTVMALFTLNYTMIDPVYARWNRSHTVQANILVVDFPDPLFERQAASWLLPSQQHRNLTVFNQSLAGLNISVLQALLTSGQYVNHAQRAPSFLERLSGNILASSSSLGGIESLIDPGDVQPGRVPDAQNASFTDWQIFRNTTSLLHCFSGMVVNTSSFTGIVPADFSLDEPHWLAYNIKNAELNTGACP